MDHQPAFNSAYVQLRPSNHRAGASGFASSNIRYMVTSSPSSLILSSIRRLNFRFRESSPTSYDRPYLLFKNSVAATAAVAAPAELMTLEGTVDIVQMVLIGFKLAVYNKTTSASWFQHSRTNIKAMRKTGFYAKQNTVTVGRCQTCKQYSSRKSDTLPFQQQLKTLSPSLGNRDHSR